VNLFLTGLFFFQWEVGYARFRRLIIASLSSHIVVHLLVSREKSICRPYSVQGGFHSVLSIMAYTAPRYVER
jgi:hypothetical protein